jgi:protein-disulfide isomerase
MRTNFTGHLRISSISGNTTFGFVSSSSLYSTSTKNRVPSFGQTAAPARNSPILATVDGQPVTDDDLILLLAEGPQLPFDGGCQKKKALENLINQKLLDAAAKKKGLLNTDKLFEQEVDSKLAEPTDAELRAVYAVQKDQQFGGRPFEDVKAQIQQSLKRAKIQQARQEYSAHLREQTKVAVLLSPPRVQVGFDPARVRGNPKAKVMIVEFSDFQCPYCGQVQSTLKSVLAKHQDTVALAFRDMPIQQIHPLAPKAAEASRCAGEQGKFWEYHDLLFGDQSRLDQAGLMDKARTLKLDEKQFESCLTSEKYKAQVQQDSQDGMRAGVTGTPGFFINGIFMSGAQAESAFESAIQEQLAASATSSKL